MDALDAGAVQEHIDAVAGPAGKIDVSFDAIGIDPAAEITFVASPMATFGNRLKLNVTLVN